MPFRLFDMIVPHYCCSCGEIGAILCEYCKYNIIDDRTVRCVSCDRMLGGNMSLCSDCSLPYRRAWYVGMKAGEMEKLIDAYKFNRAKSAGNVLAGMLDEATPTLPPEVTVTAVPTVAGHIRERGYDHAQLIGKELARRKGCRYVTALERMTSTRQRGANRRQREEQAKVAFRAAGRLQGAYLLVDDVFTTGATAKYAAKALLEGGASEVWLAVVARQPLHDDPTV